TISGWVFFTAFLVRPYFHPAAIFSAIQRSCCADVFAFGLASRQRTASIEASFIHFAARPQAGETGCPFAFCRARTLSCTTCAIFVAAASLIFPMPLVTMCTHGFPACGSRLPSERTALAL